MAGLCEGGNEPPGSLKAIVQQALACTQSAVQVSWRLASKLSTASTAIFFRDFDFVPEEDGRASRRKLGS
ncbi:hypothetical protein ANN_15115 [Periplaneta americana]|uniref:Uncharacterized protein n=1 Tax=Periplaneta americana TaxID=6978 RepID=A0ABQ8SZJ3_PERAM|nr:hypothetical protein ANN_15115 [Periplaneta americana]